MSETINNFISISELEETIRRRSRKRGRLRVGLLINIQVQLDVAVSTRDLWQAGVGKGRKSRFSVGPRTDVNHCVCVIHVTEDS